jgi:signal transduction histidine kinase
MRLSLRVRVLLVLVLLNSALFALSLYALAPRADELRREYAGETLYALLRQIEPQIAPDSDLSVVPVLKWGLWQSFPGAMVLRASYARDASGEVRPLGAWVNPRGRFRRPADFEEGEVLGHIVSAIESRSTRIEEQGIAAPILDSSGAVWGGLWLPLKSAPPVNLVWTLLPWFLLSLLVLTLFTFTFLRRTVLDPLGQLVLGQRRVQAGDLSVQLAVPERNDELADLVRGFNAMTAGVQGFNERLAREVEIVAEKARIAEAAARTGQRLAAMGELTAGIAHEINNPLGGMLNATEALESGQLPPERRARYFKLLRMGLTRIQSTVGQLLRLTPRATPSAAPFQLCDAFLDALGLVQHRLDRSGTEVVFFADGVRLAREQALARWREQPALHGARGELAQALLNLLVNALDALEGARTPRPCIELELSLGEREQRVRVRDNGPGVPAELLERIANPFFTTKEVGQGSGLGLSIVSGVVSAHGGRMQLANHPQGGLEVRWQLPRASQADAPGERH